MPARKKISKNDYIFVKINELTAEIYQNEIARDFALQTPEKERSDEHKKSINAANHNIERLQAQIKWLEKCKK